MKGYRLIPVSFTYPVYLPVVLLPSHRLHEREGNVWGYIAAFPADMDVEDFEHDPIVFED